MDRPISLSPDLITLVQTLDRTMRAWMPDFQADLAWMVGHDRGYHYKAGVDAAVNWMAARLEGLGCAIQMFTSDTTGNAVAGTLRGRGRGRYLLIAHLDTVWPEGTAAGWPLVISGTRASGPGVVDNGSGSLTSYYVLKALQHAGYNEFESVTLVANGDEESGSLFSGAIIQQLAAGCDAAFCLEAPDAPDEIISQRGGSMGVDLRVTGKRAHTQIDYDQGANAILELCHKVLAAHTVAGEDGEPLACVVTAAGGPQSGTVPDTAQALFDIRLKSLADVARVDARFQEIAARAWVPGTTATASSLVYHPPMDHLPGTPRLVALAQAIGRELGTELKDTYCLGVSDGCFGPVAGTPTLCGLAPHGAEYHTRGEWLDLSNVPDRVTLVAALVAASRPPV